jgi:Tannase-like family of unknown function (DUF6351)
MNLMQTATTHQAGRLSIGILVILTVVGALIPASTLTATQSVASNTGADRQIVIRTLSTRADRVSGDDVLIEVAPPAGGTAAAVVMVNGRDVSSAFQSREGGRWIGLVTGLSRGDNRVDVKGAPWGVPDTSLTITNYPSTGPIVSGPHTSPFICQTDTFLLPDGRPIGPALDANCTFQMRVQYVYRAVGAKAFAPLADPKRLPADVATTTTLTGATVPFVVRVETGAMNRGIYQNVVLHDPTSEPEPTPFTPPRGWNRRLIAVHGTGCPGGWYRQGGVMGVNPLDMARLGEGYALFTNTLNHPSNSCNAFLAGETTMMGKEHFIETFGVPLFTVSMGTSGGAYTSLQVADAFPGLIDGIVMQATFPDALSIAVAGLDAHLLTHYFAGPGASLTDAQKVAVSGYHGIRALVDAANQAQRTDPVPGRPDIEGYRSAVWNDAVPEAVRYHARTNPTGARPTVFDAARNVYGVDPVTGVARRPYDNSGVQYGLAALNDGVIRVEQFLDLNQRIGGFDQDANYVAARSVADAGALQRAYQAGLTLGGGGGLASIPVFDAGRYNEEAAYHYQWFHFAVRERLRAENGRADNHLMWRGAVPPEKSWSVLERWVTAAQADRGEGSAYEKVVRNKPADAIDGCWQETAGQAPRFIAEPQTFGRADSECNRSLPSYSFARQVAGGPLHGNVLKCQLKPIDAADYRVPFSAGAIERLRRIFPAGVCDWSKPGVNQVPVLPWLSFGPAPDSRVPVPGTR